jgi:hypothetical protein
VTLSADTSRALSGSDDGTVRLWDLATRESLSLRTVEWHTGPVTAVALSADASRALSLSDDRTLRLWDLTTRKSLRTLERHTTGPVAAVALSADGRRALCSWDNTLRLWDLATGKSLRTLEGRTGEVTAVALSADASRALAGCYWFDRTLRLWDLATGESLRTFEGHTAGVTAVALSADSRHALSGSNDGTLRVWDLATGKSLCTLEGHTRSVTAVALSADASRALSGSWDKTLRLWDLATGKSLRTLEGHSATVTAVALSADGSRALSSSDDHTLRLWDLATGKSLAEYMADAAIGCVCAERSDRCRFRRRQDPYPRNLRAGPLSGGLSVAKTGAAVPSPAPAVPAAPNVRRRPSSDSRVCASRWSAACARNCRGAGRCPRCEQKPIAVDATSNVEFLSPRAREEHTPRCAKRRSPLRSNRRKRHAICSRRGGRLVQWTAGRRRSRRDSRLIVNQPSVHGQLAGISKLNPRRLGTRFYKSEVRSDLASAERAGSAGKHCSSRARGDKNSPVTDSLQCHHPHRPCSTRKPLGGSLPFDHCPNRRAGTPRNYARASVRSSVWAATCRTRYRAAGTSFSRIYERHRSPTPPARSLLLAQHDPRCWPETDFGDRTADSLDELEKPLRRVINLLIPAGIRS